jgi:hypothetical protein
LHVDLLTAPPAGQLLWLWFSPRAHSAHSQKLSGLLTGHWLAAARCGTDDHIAAGQFLPSFSLFPAVIPSQACWLCLIYGPFLMSAPALLEALAITF